MNKSQIKSFFIKTAGFTLIELLIVIAVIGVLATVVLVAIDPLEQLARSRDAGRKSSISQLSNAIQAYATVNGGNYFNRSTVIDTWQDNLIGSSDIKTKVIAPITTGSVCRVAASGGFIANDNNFCYWGVSTSTTKQAVIWVLLESKSEIAKANCTTSPYTTVAFGWDSSQNKKGYICLAGINDIPWDSTGTGEFPIK
jgi:prepilin-type N-terminal cleavage/methylation domain-containing protein